MARRAGLADALRNVALLLTATSRVVGQAPCTPAGLCRDAEGTTWDLGPIGAEQTVAGPSDPTYNYQYAFSLYQNLDPVPQICQTFSIFGTNAARFDDSSFGTCEQLGPDMNLSPQYTFTAVDEVLTFVFGYSGSQLTVTLKCSFSAGKGTPGAVTGTAPMFNVEWQTNYACEGGAARGGSEGGNWGMTFLILFFVGGALYAGGGFYYNTRTKGATGMEAIPNLEFWQMIPGLVKDGVVFSQAKYNEKYGDGQPVVMPPREEKPPPPASAESTPILPTTSDTSSAYGSTSSASPAASPATKEKKKRRKKKKKKSAPEPDDGEAKE